MSKTIEIEETQFLANQPLAKVVSDMLKHKDARKLILSAQKLVQPDAVIPEIDAAAPIKDELEKAKKEFADGLAEIKKAREDEVAERRRAELTSKWEAGRNSLKAEGYNDEGIAAVEKLMEQKGLIDHEDGKTIFEKLHPPQTPAQSTGFGSFNFLDDAKGDKADTNMKRLLESRGEDEGALNSMVNTALQEARAQRR